MSVMEMLKEICPLLAAMITVGRRTDIMKITDTFRDYANASKARDFSEQSTPSSKPYSIPS